MLGRAFSLRLGGLLYKEVDKAVRQHLYGVEENPQSYLQEIPDFIKSLTTFKKGLVTKFVLYSIWD